MRNDVNNIDNLFKEGLGSYTEVPPPDVWDALENRLDNDRKKKPFGWRWFFVMLGCIGLFGSLYAWKMQTDNAGDSGVPEAIASVQQAADNKATQASSPDNTSAGNTQTAINTTNQHTKARKAHDITTTSNTNSQNESVATNTTTDNTPSANNADARNNSIMDNTAVAMADNPSSAKSNAVGYIFQNKNRNNIAVAESEPTYSGNGGYPAVANNDASDEDEVTFGKKPVVDYEGDDDGDSYNIPLSTTKHTAKTVLAIKHNNNGHTKHTNTATATHAFTTRANTYVSTKSTQVKTSVTTTNNNSKIRVARIGNKKPRNILATGKPSVIDNEATSAAAVASAITKPTPTAKKIAALAGNSVAATKEKTDKPTVGAIGTVHQADVATATISQTDIAVTKTKTRTAKHTKTAIIAATVQTEKAVTGTAKKNVSSVDAIPLASSTKAYVGKKKAVKASVATSVAVNNPVATTAKAAAKKKPAKHSQIANGTKTASDVPADNIADANSQAVAVTKVTTAKKQKAVTVTAIAKTTATKIAAVKPAGKKQQAATATVAAAKKKATKRTPVQKPVPAVAMLAAKATNTTTKLGTKPAINPASTPAVTLAVAKVTPAASKIMGTFKADTAAPSMAPKPADTTALAMNTTPDTGKRQKYNKYSYGIKAGYEGGFTHDASNKLVISPFIERQLSAKFSLMLQPALKSSKARSNGLSGTQTFYKTDPNGTITNVDTFLVPVIQNNGTNGYLIRINVAYKETHDSIVKSYATGGNYLELELPILLKYAINPKLSVYGGVSLNYSKYIQIKENTFTSKPITVNDTTFTIYPYAPNPISSVLSYTGNNISTYSGPLYPAQSGGLFRLGYMLGVSYEIKKRWMLDALVQKAPAKTNIQGGYDVNKGLSTTYFRFTLGYRLSK